MLLSYLSVTKANGKIKPTEERRPLLKTVTQRENVTHLSVPLLQG